MKCNHCFSEKYSVATLLLKIILTQCYFSLIKGIEELSYIRSDFLLLILEYKFSLYFLAIAKFAFHQHILILCVFMMCISFMSAIAKGNTLYLHYTNLNHINSGHLSNMSVIEIAIAKKTRFFKSISIEILLISDYEKDATLYKRN